jgi:type II secretory pathway pseudopilin PulG
MRFPSTNQLVIKILRHERGATLVEELMTVAIIGFGIVILVAMIYTGVVGVRLVDDKVVAESLARSQLELVKEDVYHSNPVTSPYPSVASVPGYTVSVDIEYWNASTGNFTTALQTDGMQKITVTVSTGGDDLVQTSALKVDR